MNENKTKCTTLSRTDHNRTGLFVGKMRFKGLETFKYIGTGVDTTTIGGHGNVQRRISTEKQMLKTLFKQCIKSFDSIDYIYMAVRRELQRKLRKKKIMIFEGKYLDKYLARKVNGYQRMRTYKKITI